MPATLDTPVLPELASSRVQARTLLANLPQSLEDAAVQVDCRSLLSSAPSFVDETVKIILVQRKAARLILNAAPPRLAQLAMRAATNHNVGDRLQINPA